MKKYPFYLLCAALSASAVPAVAADYDSNYEPELNSGYVTTARVVGSSPVIETVYENVEVCRYENRRQKSRRNSDIPTEKIIGGVVGGAAGSAVGGGSGRDVAAALGAIIGSQVADGEGELTGGEIIGGVAGGLLGNQIGSGSGKTAATAAGALFGSIIGDRVQKGPAPKETTSTKKVRVCEVEERPKKVITGYEVTVEYDGFHFTDIVPRKPGDYLNINVNVEFIEDLTAAQSN